MQKTIPILGPYEKERSIQVNGQKTINMYLAPQQPGAKSPFVLYSMPGLRYKSMIGNGGARSNFTKFKDAVYGVMGSRFVSVTNTFGVTEIGTVATGSGRCSVAAGRNYVAFVDGTNGYYYDGTTYGTVTDTNFSSNPSHLINMDGYFITNDTDTDQFQISSDEDPTTWAATDTANAEKRPDGIKAIANTKSHIYLIGEYTTELWYNNGNADFPFIRVPDGVLEYGIHAPHSVARCKFGILYYAETEEGYGQIVLVNGMSVQAVSKHSLDFELANTTDTTDAFAFCYEQSGRLFYEITFPTANRTFVVEIPEGTWSERTTEGVGRHRIGGHGYIGQVNIVGDYANENIYQLDPTYYTDNGEFIKRERITQILHSERNRLIVNMVELEVESGSSTDPSDDPYALMRYSTDGGKSWSTWLSRSMGKTGEYSQRLIWRVGIYGRSIVFHFRIAEDLDCTIIGGYAQIEVMRS